MIVENLIHFIGALLKHVIGVLLLCWRRMLRAGVITFFLGVVAALLVSVVTTGQAIPSALTFIVALLFGLALGYAVALTVMIEEFVLGVIDIIRMLEGDVAAAAHITEVVAEREVGEVGQGLRRLAGLAVSKRAPARAAATLPPLTRAAAPARPIRASETAVVAAAGAASAVAAGAAALAATRAAARPPAPAPAPVFGPPSSPLPAEEAAGSAAPGDPVPADRLPRITWTYEHEAVRPPAPAATEPAGAAAAATTPLVSNPGEPEPPAPARVALDAIESPADLAAPLAGAGPLAENAAPESAALPPSTETVAPAPIAGEEVAPAELAEPGHEAAARFHIPHVPEALVGAAQEIVGGVAASHLLEALLAHGASHTQEPAPEADYEDERLAAPASVTAPEGPAEPAVRPDSLDEGEEGVAGGEAAATPPAQPAARVAPQATPATTPLPAAQATSAPATTPLPAEEELAAEPLPGSALAAPAEPGEPTEPAESTVSTAPASDTSAESAERPPTARRTLPLGGGASLERPRTESGPRASVPESGLWERLSSALINRSGAPSGPFAPAPATSDESADGGSSTSGEH